MGVIGEFIRDHWQQALEIAILWVVIYNTYRYFKSTRGARIFTALVAIYIGSYLLSDWLSLKVIGSLLKYVTVFLATAIVIIFQPEVRRALAELGSHRIFSSFTAVSRAKFADLLVDIAQNLSRKRTGALISIERSIELNQYLETGTEMDCLLTPEIVYTVFYNGTTLHDGGMIISMADERIKGAGCVFPLKQGELSDQSIGLRHRAAMGLSEETDAIALVVSEETGAMSLAVDGKLERDLEPKELRERLNELLNQTRSNDDEEDQDEQSSSEH